MPAVIVDIWDSHDINGAYLKRMTDEDTFFKGFSLRPSLVENGAWDMTLKRRVGFALVSSGVIGPENLVRIMLPELGTKYLWGGFFTNRVLEVLSEEEEAGEDWTFGGPGPMFYLHRAIMRAHQETNNGWNLDLDNGIWRWKESAPAGRVLHRLIKETQERNPDFLPGLTYNFGDSTDSLSVPWTNELTPNDDEWEIAIGTDILSALREMQDAVDFDVLVDLGDEATPKFELQAFNAPYGRNLAATANDFTTGVLFKEGVNIATNMEAVGVAQRKATHVLVHGLEDAYVWVVKPSYSGGFRKAVFLDYGKTKNETILERRGLRFLRNQDLGEDEFEFQHAGGFDPTNGIYFPSLPSQLGHYWLGDTVTIKTGPDVSWSVFDWHYEEERVLAIRMELTDASDDTDDETFARSWLIVPEFNVERDSDSSPTQAGNRAGGGGGGGGGCPVCLRLCLVAEANPGGATDIVRWTWTTNGNDDTDTYASNVTRHTSTTHYAADAHGDIGTGNSPTQPVPVDEGETIRVVMQRRWKWTPSDRPITVRFWASTINGGLQGDGLIEDWVFESGVGRSTNVLYDLSADHVVPVGANWVTISWDTFDNSAVVDNMAIQTVTEAGSSTGTFPEDVVHQGFEETGTSSRAARCDHKHAHGFLSADGAHYHDATMVEYDPAVAAILTKTDMQEALDEHVLDGTAHGGGGGGGHVIKEDGTPLTQRAGLNFGAGLLATDDAGNDETDVALDADILTSSLVVTLDASPDVLAVGSQAMIRVPFACDIVRASAIAAQSGSVVVDVWKDSWANFPPTDADSITASAPITISSAQKVEDTTLTGWTLPLAEGDVLIFNIDSATTIQTLVVELKVSRT